jgi:hypothetical protein
MVAYETEVMFFEIHTQKERQSRTEEERDGVRKEKKNVKLLSLFKVKQSL